MKTKSELMISRLQESVTFNAKYYHCCNPGCRSRFIAHRFQAQCPRCREGRMTEVASA